MNNLKSDLIALDADTENTYSFVFDDGDLLDLEKRNYGTLSLGDDGNILVVSVTGDNRYFAEEASHAAQYMRGEVDFRYTEGRWKGGFLHDQSDEVNARLRYLDMDLNLEDIGYYKSLEAIANRQVSASYPRLPQGPLSASSSVAEIFEARPFAMSDQVESNWGIIQSWTAGSFLSYNNRRNDLFNIGRFVINE